MLKRWTLQGVIESLLDAHNVSQEIQIHGLNQQSCCPNCIDDHSRPSPNNRIFPHWHRLFCFEVEKLVIEILVAPSQSRWIVQWASHNYPCCQHYSMSYSMETRCISISHSLQLGSSRCITGTFSCRIRLLASSEYRYFSFLAARPTNLWGPYQ